MIALLFGGEVAGNPGLEEEEEEEEAGGGGGGG